MKLLFTQEQPQIHYITLKHENRSKRNQTLNFTTLQGYNNTINITNSLQLKQLSLSLVFQHLSKCTCTYKHEVTVSRRTKVATRHSNLHSPSPYCFSLLVVPLSRRRIVYTACYRCSKSTRLHHLSV